MLRNEALERLEPLVGSWNLTLSDAWFLDPPESEVRGNATFEWLGDAFVVMRADMDGKPTWDFVFGRSDANDAYEALYHDDRGVCRRFHMTFGDGDWRLVREDPDFHQRFIARVDTDRITGRWEASEDLGSTWRKDFELTFTRSDPSR